MAQFAFVARDTEGRVQRGTLDVGSEAQLLARLRGSGLFALHVEPLSARQAGTSIAANVTWSEHVFTPRAVDIEIGLQQLAYMLRSGLPLLSALRSAAEQAPRRSVARVWHEVSAGIQAGSSLSSALARQRCIPEVVTTMVAVGEKTGELGTVLVRAATAMERRRALKASLVTALTYPAIVVCMSIAAVAYMMIALIPKLSKMLLAFGRRLPPMTQLLVDVSNAVSQYFMHGVIALLVLIVAFLAFRAWPPGRLILDRAVLRIPLIGSLHRLAATATFARHGSLLLSSGVRLTEALRVIEPLLFNRYIAAQVAQVRERVLQGSSLADPLAATGVFYPMLPSMAAIGESSGTLDAVLEHVAEYHDTRLSNLIRRLGSLIEPVLIIVLGGIVGFIYMAFFLAIYAIAGGGQ